jgi:tetratricopeptide (TPR) repeat protein
LAAARVKLFTPEQIAERLDDRFKLLTGGSRTALERQQTLRALIDWSYITLNEVEQRTLRHLAVFSGGWTFEAAESVIGEAEAMDGLMGLVNKSLVNVEEQEHESRYRFLETIRQYAMEKLSEAGESEQARDRQFDYIMKLALGSKQELFGTESLEWLDQMEAEHDNLRAALEWGITSDPIKALELANAVGGFWGARDYGNETRSTCSAILAKTERTENVDSLRAKVFGILAWASITSGYPKEGRDAAKEGIKLARKVNDAKTFARCSSILALTSIFLGDIDTALRVGKEVEELARRENYNLELSMILTTLAQAIYSSTHDAPRAKAYIEEAVKIGKAAGSQWTDTMSAFGVAQVAGMLGDLESAREKFEESAKYALRFGNKRLVYSSQSELAHIQRKHGKLDEPLATYRDLLPRWNQLGHLAAVAHELECIAFILIRKEEPERAASLMAAAGAIRKVIDSPMTHKEQEEFDNEVASLRSGISDDEFNTHWSNGSSMTIDDAIELALSE